MDKQQELDLIEKAQQGDMSAENAVALQYLSLAKSIARSFNMVADCDDLTQLGMLGLIRAIRTFKPDGKASFKTYASRCIRNAIVDAVRKHDAESVNIDECEPKDVSPDPENLFIQNETSTLLFEAIRSLLTPTEFSVLKLHLECMSYAEIAKELGLERKKVDNTIYSAKKKIKKLLEK